MREGRPAGGTLSAARPTASPAPRQRAAGARAGPERAAPPAVAGGGQRWGREPGLHALRSGGEELAVMCSRAELVPLRACHAVMLPLSCV